MKINLVFDLKNSLSGYNNIDVGISGPTLDEVCEDAECTEIVADDVVNYFPAEYVSIILDNWIKKLRHGGQLIVGGTDLNEVSRQFFNKNINLSETNILLYGEQREPYQFRQSGLTSYDLAKSLKDCGLHILKNRINNFHFTIVAERK